MRAPVVVGLGSLVLVAILELACAGAPAERQFKFSAFMFQRGRGRAICEGRISAQTYQKWFKKDYLAAGERIEVPKDAAAFGVLILTDGEEILGMPFYRWKAGEENYFACQGAVLGQAPMFSVIEQTEDAFSRALKQKLAELEKAGKGDPAAGATSCLPVFSCRDVIDNDSLSWSD